MDSNRELVRFDQDILYAWQKAGNNTLIEALQRKDRSNNDSQIVILKPLRGEIGNVPLFDIDSEYITNASNQEQDGNVFVERGDIPE